MVERLPSKQDVEGSNPFSRSISTHLANGNGWQERFGEPDCADTNFIDLYLLERLLNECFLRFSRDPWMGPLRAELI